MSTPTLEEYIERTQTIVEANRDARRAEAAFEHRVIVIGYGPFTWEVCDDCNYNLHRCPACGDDLTHAESRSGSHIRRCRPDLFDAAGNML